jgi:uncharacterized UBP type Zn finger protein
MKEDATGKVQLAAIIREKIEQGLLDIEACQHLPGIQDVVPSADGCEKCLKLGDEWVHLRLCLTCGHVGCCDHSKHQHATRPFHQTGHPMIVSYEPEEDWMWCYVDQVLVSPQEAE